MSTSARLAVRDPLEPHHELGLGDDVVVDAGHAPGRAPSRLPAAPERDLELQPIAGHDLPAELGVVDAAQPGAARSCAPSRPCISRMVATCASVSIISTPASAARRENAPGRNPR